MAGYELFMQEMSYGKQPEDWREKAHCVLFPKQWFEVIERGSPRAGDLDNAELAELNRSNFRQAEEVCIECPVMFPCGDAASAEDKAYTVRGGEWPKGTQGPMCRQGKHVKPGPGRCLECKKETTARSDERRRTKSASEV